MHPDLEKLIDLAVVDGKLTDKEKEILQRKARELNVDLDELDMVLEAKLFIQNKDLQENLSPSTSTEAESNSNSEQKSVKVTKYFNEDYKEYLKKIICKDKIIFKLNPSRYVPIKMDNCDSINDTNSVDENFALEFKVIEGIDSVKFLNENVSVSTYLINGEFLLVIRLEELLYYKLFDDINYVFNKFSVDELEKDNIYIVKSFLDGKKEKSRNELEKLINRSTSTQLDWIFAAYCYNSLFNDFVQARKWLDELLEEDNDDGLDLFELAEAFKLLFNEEKEVKRILMDCTDELQDWIEYAFMWKELLNDDREVKRYIKLGEEEKEYFSWFNCALSWKWLLNNDNEAKRCLLEAEKIANANNDSSYSAIASCAQAWKETLNDDNEVRRWLKRAESVAYGARLKDLAMKWMKLLNDESEARRCQGIVKISLDQDGNSFIKVKIGNQIWMAENLNVEHYRNGDPIPQVQDERKWAKLKTGAWCYYENYPENGKKYGKLYSWYAVNDPRGLAPEGWHIPTKAELETLKAAVNNDGNSLKAIGQGSGVGVGTNTSGFSALLAGSRFDGGYFNFGKGADFWSSTEEDDAAGAYGLNLHHVSSLIEDHGGHKDYGYSVRCLKD